MTPRRPLLFAFQMNLVSSMVVGGEGEIPRRPHPNRYEGEPEQPENFLSFLMNSDGSWGEFDYDEPIESDTTHPVPLPMKAKKHLGSLAAASGLRLPAHHELGFVTGAYHQPVLSYKRGIPPPLLQRFFGRRVGLGQGSRQKKDTWDGPKLFRHQEQDDASGESNPTEENGIFYDGPLSLDSLYKVEAAGEEGLSPFRGKRFMGECHSDPISSRRPRNY